MSRFINENLRKLVENRANDHCEYCLISISDTYFGGEIDHILSIKHHGKTDVDNLALACQPCNRNKGTDIGSFSHSSRSFIRFFNPRIDDWSDHFRVNPVAEVEPLTVIGEVTTLNS